jgi:hypothetical protein
VAGIFISYRRDDAQGWAGRLTDDLHRHLPGVHVFRDIDTIPAGTPFAEYTARAVGTCDVLIALIGPRWLNAVDERGHRRLDNPHDLTRIEIIAALQRNVRVIPTLVAGTPMPRPLDLPDELQPLLARQAYQLDDRAWKDDVKRLVAVLAPLVATRRPWRAALTTVTVVLALLALALGGYASLSWFARVDSESTAVAPPPSARDAKPSEAQSKPNEGATRSSEPQPAPAPPPKDASPPRSPLARTSQPLITATSPAPAKPPDTATTRVGEVTPSSPEPLNIQRALLDAQVKARTAYTSAVTWLDRAERAAKAARASANEAGRLSGEAKSAFRTRASFEASQAVQAPLRKAAAAAGQAAGRAEEGVRKVREAVATAEASAQETVKATDPDTAARTASGTAAAEDTARTATADVEKEAEAAAQFASSAGTAFEQVKAQMPRVEIRETSCAAIGPGRYRVELAGEAAGPPTASLSIRVAAPEAYSFEADLICMAWRRARNVAGTEDPYRCQNVDIGTPSTRWRATVFFFPARGDVAPHEASAQVNDDQQTGLTHVVVPLKCG